MIDIIDIKKTWYYFVTSLLLLLLLLKWSFPRFNIDQIDMYHILLITIMINRPKIEDRKQARNCHIGYIDISIEKNECINVLHGVNSY